MNCKTSRRNSKYSEDSAGPAVQHVDSMQMLGYRPSLHPKCGPSSARQTEMKPRKLFLHKLAGLPQLATFAVRHAVCWHARKYLCWQLSLTPLDITRAGTHFRLHGRSRAGQAQDTPKLSLGTNVDKVPVGVLLPSYSSSEN